MFTISFVIPITDQEHDKNQEDEEETAEEDREERHAGSDAEGTEADCKRQRAEKQQGWPRFNLNTGKQYAQCFLPSCFVVVKCSELKPFN